MNNVLCLKAPFLMSQCCPDYSPYPMYPDRPINIRNGLCIPPYVALTYPDANGWRYVATRACTVRCYSWGGTVSLYVNGSETPTKSGDATDGSVVFTHAFSAGDTFTVTASYYGGDYRLMDADLADAWLGIFTSCGAAADLNHPTDAIYQACQDALYAAQMDCEMTFWNAMSACFALPEEEQPACMAEAEATYNACLAGIDWASCDTEANAITACLRDAGIIEYQSWWDDPYLLESLRPIVENRQAYRQTGYYYDTSSGRNVFHDELRLFQMVWGHPYPFGILPPPQA